MSIEWDDFQDECIAELYKLIEKLTDRIKELEDETNR